MQRQHAQCSGPESSSRAALRNFADTPPSRCDSLCRIELGNLLLVVPSLITWICYHESCQVAEYRVSGPGFRLWVHSVDTSVFLGAFPCRWTNSYCFRVGLRYEPGHWSRTIDTFLLIEDNSTSLTLLDADYPGRVTIPFFLIHAISPLSAPQHFPLTAI